MADDIQITTADMEALAARLDDLSGEFSDSERAALEAVFQLAGSAITDGSEVEGFSNTTPKFITFSTGARDRGIRNGFARGLNFGIAGPHVAVGGQPKVG